MGFCTVVGAIPLFKFGKQTTNSKFGEACLPLLTDRELKEQQCYMTTLIVPTLLVARVQPRNWNRSTSSYLSTAIREDLSTGIPNILKVMFFTRALGKNPAYFYNMLC